jgi:hypothetical protein
MGPLGGGNSGFDQAFSELEIVALLASLVLAVLAAVANRRPPWGPTLVLVLLPVQIVIGLIAVAVLPIVWQIGWPPDSGFERAGRFLFGWGPACGLNAIVCVLACVLPRLRRDGERRL